MQEGMLFHAIADKESLAYTEQTSFDINGHVDIEFVEKSINILIEKYDILRTAIVYKEVEEPRQLVLKQRELKIYFEDKTNMTEGEREKSIEEFEKIDRERGFDLTKDNLLRLALIKKGEDSYNFV